jgi:hypothetical protein
MSRTPILTFTRRSHGLTHNLPGNPKNVGWVEPRASPTNKCVAGLDPLYESSNGRKQKRRHKFGTPTPCAPARSLARSQSIETVAPGALLLSTLLAERWVLISWNITSKTKLVYRIYIAFNQITFNGYPWIIRSIFIYFA